METWSDCARRRRVCLADTQYVVKLSGECRRKWLDIRFGVAAVRFTSKRERFVVAVVDLVYSFTKGRGRLFLLQYRKYTTKRRGRLFLLQYRKYTTKRRGRLFRTPIP